MAPSHSHSSKFTVPVFRNRIWRPASSRLFLWTFLSGVSSAWSRARNGSPLSKRVCVCVCVWDKSECVCGVTSLLNARHIKHTHTLTHSQPTSLNSAKPSPVLLSSSSSSLSFPSSVFSPIIPHAHLCVTSAKRWKLPLISNLTFSRYRSGWVYPSHASVPTKPFITEEFLKTAPVSNGRHQKLIPPLTT